MDYFDQNVREYEDFRVDSVVVGPIMTNAYFVTNLKTKEVLIVDPGDEAEVIEKWIKSENLRPAAILLTHGHLDHFGAAEALRKAFGIPVYCYETEKRLLEDDRLNCSRAMGMPQTLTPDHLLMEGEEKTLAGLTFRVLHTPGHTAGSCCFYFTDYRTLLSGDTLFCTSYGRTDLPTGSMRDMVFSLKKLLMLPDEVTVYPGHGDVTSVAFEKQMNPVALYL